MIETDHASDLPTAVLIAPEVDEPSLAGGLMRFRVKETVYTDLDGAIALDAMRLQRATDQFSLHVFTADVVFDAFRQFVYAQNHAIPVVIELQVVGEEGPELCQIAAVIGIEKRRVQRLD